jgi:threonine/homoserine/homoserine lactone efflux protein
MSIESVLAFWAVAILLIVVPGADWAFTISAGLRGRSVLPAVGGLVIGYTAMTLVVAAGVGALVAQSSIALITLTVVGGAYLMWHGAMTLARPAAPATVPAPAPDLPDRTDWDTLVKGIGVSGLNPKGLLIFLALLPQFTRPGQSWPVAGQLGLLGLVFTLTCAVFYLGLGSFARTVLLARPSFARGVGRAAGAAMFVIGGLLIADRLLA